MIQDKVPKIIHKIWFNFKNTVQGETPPEQHLFSEIECRRINKDYNIMFWNEQKANDFIKAQYPFFYSYFMRYPKKIQKVDALRYFLLHHYGGVYMDSDIRCLKRLRNFDNKVYLVQDSNSLNPIKFNNFFMASPAGHPFWEVVFQKLIENFDKRWYHNDFFFVLYSTGPGMLTQAYNRYVFPSEISMLSPSEFNPCDACGKCSISNAYIIHDGTGLWTATADSILRWVYCNLQHIVLIIFLILFLIFLGNLFFSRK